MTIDYHGRRWLVVRAHTVSTHPGILLERREGGIPGFHIVFVDTGSTLTVVGKG